MAKSQATNRITTLPALVSELVNMAKSQTPEEKARMKVALVKFAAGRSKWRGEWVN
jgi:hypothetical protein